MKQLTLTNKNPSLLQEAPLSPSGAMATQSGMPAARWLMKAVQLIIKLKLQALYTTTISTRPQRHNTPPSPRV